VWGLPYNTHNLLLPLICCRLPLYDELMKRLLVFVQNCLTCDSELVTFVSRYAVWYGRMLSATGRNVLHCSLRYGFVVRSGSELNCQVIRNFYWQSVSRDDVDKARILLELLFVRLGNFCNFVCLILTYTHSDA